MKILLLDIAWLAGLLEGEGCFKMQSSGGYKGSICISLQMTDKDVVQRVTALLDGTLWGPHGPYGHSKLPTYQTAIFGSKAASWMMTLFPLMGERRQGKIKELLDYWKTQPTIIVDKRPLCHPEKKHAGKGLCTSCYMKQYHKEKKNSYITS